MNILFVGSSGPLSLLPFKKLLSSEHDVVATGIYNPLVFETKIIALENESLALASSQAIIPVIDLSSEISDILKQLSSFSIDVIIMSCYGKRLPDEISGIAPFGCFNLHPSLLPRFRGPEPIFWQMKYGADTGVSWHRVTQDFDAGDIAVQQRVFLDEGATHQEISSQLAEKGATSLEHLLTELAQDTLTLTPQDTGKASYQHYPQQQDFSIDAQQDAQQAYNFMCATQAFGFHYQYKQGRHTYLLKQALDYDNNASLASAEVQADRLYIPCKDGVLIAEYTDMISG